MSIDRIPLKTCEQMAIMAAARSGPRELARLRDALAGKRAYVAQVRLLLELARRGHVDLSDLASSDKERRS